MPYVVYMPTNHQPRNTKGHEMIRVITMASEDGSLESESVVFTEDPDYEPEDWVTPGQVITSVQVLDDELHPTFPLETVLSK